MAGKNHLRSTPTFHLEKAASYYEDASYTWSEDSIRYMNTVSAHARNREGITPLEYRKMWKNC